MLSTRPITANRAQMLRSTQRVIGRILLLISIRLIAVAHREDIVDVGGGRRCGGNGPAERRRRRGIRWRRRLKLDLIEGDYRSTPTSQRAQRTSGAVVHRLDG